MELVEVQLKTLMLAGIAGDANAHRRLLETAAVRLRAYYARRLASNAADVEDLVQDCLIAIHSRRGSYDPGLPFTVWLHAIARHKLIDYFRRKGVRKHVPLDEAAELVAPDETAGLLAFLDLERLLDGLPPRHQQAIRLTRLQGCSVAEAATISGQSQSAIKIGVHRGMKRLITLVIGIARDHH